jgi:UDP-N-acetylglucosamine--N-acetylmuramyl-(pentapeptide) pyrophosphoryl-undecaprenol N-acetylglucosamine transferase
VAEENRHRVLFAGGGTAGHLMPAINIALALARKDQSFSALFIGKRGGMEAGIVKRFGFEIREIEVVALKRNPMGVLRFIWNWNKGLKQAQDIIKDFQPQVVVGTGGYVSAPVVRAARKNDIPIFMQEQNSLPGLATRTLSKNSEKIFIAYQSAANYLPREKCVMVGNPIRPDLLDGNKGAALVEFELASSLKTLLIVGGSSGAHGINSALLRIVNSGLIPAEWQLLWQIGQKEFEQFSKAIDKTKFRGKILPFINNMPGAYATADMILSRAGAMALAEIAAWGLPSILIPYPFATGDHQTLNACEFAETSAAVVIPESEIVEKLKVALVELFSDDSKRLTMAQAAKKLARPEAANIIAETILEKINEVQKN